MEKKLNHGKDGCCSEVQWSLYLFWDYAFLR